MSSFIDEASEPNSASGDTWGSVSWSTPPIPRPRVVGVGKAAWQHAACVAIVWFVAIAAVAIWVNGRGLQTMTQSFPRFVQEMGALVGMIAAVLMLFQVLFMSRFPLFEHGFGRDVIVAVHKKVGFWSFFAILAHVALVVIGYNLAIDDNPWTRPGTLLWYLRYAIIGTLIVIGAAIVLSIPIIRKRLSYDAWHWWHMVAYVGAFLTVPHQIFVGGSFLISTTATVFWILLWGCTFGAVGLWRILIPFLRFRRHDLRVHTVYPDGARGISVVMKGRDLDRLGTKAGQFFVWRFLGSPRWLRANPISISSPPTNDTLTIAVRVVGDGTERMATLQPGQRVHFEGPYGRISGDLRTGERLLMFAAGAGVGPMISLLADQQWASGNATLITRENVSDDAMMLAEINHLVTERGLVWLPFIGEPAPSGSRWLPVGDDGEPQDGVALIRQWLGGDVDDVDVFLCGPPPWMVGVQADLAAAGVPDLAVHVESFQF